MTDVNKIVKDARNVLVGKVPDPQSQIDQITLALIYKFMGAKDAEAIALGIEPQFFVGECADYSFSKIMKATSNSKQYEMYTKGIDLLQKRTDLPETFTSVFKDAFIPYRDASTLHLFLEEINKIPTENTEILGTAFEDLLSIMGSQGDAGQFRTPRHIIDMIVDIVEPKKGETILDPACGTAGFLISAYNKISKQDLTIEEREKLINEGLVGYDINPNMVKLSHVNLFLHGCKKPNIHLYDTLSDKDFWKDNYDVILANPPFMTPRGGIRPHELFSAINANRSEVLFTYYIAKHLKSNGRAGIIVPEGVVFQSANAYKNLRKMLVEEKYLYAVISLPAGVFNPYSGVKTSVLLFDKALARRTDKILFVKMNNDGFDLGAQRRPIEKNDIPEIIKIVKKFAFCVSTESEKDFIDDSGLSIVTTKAEIAKNDYVLVGDRYVKSINLQTKWKMAPLSYVCDVLRGLTYRKEDESNTKTINGVLRANNIDLKSNSLDLSEIKYLNESIAYDESKKVRENDILVCASSGSRQHLGKFALIPKGVEFYFGGFMYVLRPRQNINPKYLYYNLLTGYYRNYIDSLLAGANINNIRASDLSSFEIPLPPIEMQEQIVAELESYQKIIDGARQIVENYRPTIYFDEQWKVVKLGSIAKLTYGYTATAQEAGSARLIRITDISPAGLINNFNQKYVDLNDQNTEYVLKRGDIIVARTGATFGKTAIFDYEYPAVYASFLIKIDFIQRDVLNKFYWIFAQSPEYWDQANKLVGGGGQPQFNANAISKIEVPIPPIEVQKNIISKVEDEMIIVEQNKRLIQIFEQKIKDKINEVWGSETK